MKRLILSLSLFASLSIFAQDDPIFHWAKAVGGTGFDSAYGVISDADGNVYSVGSFNNTVDFNPGSGVFNLTQAGLLPDAFVQKYDANGNFVWAKRVGGNYSTGFFKIGFAANGDLILGGELVGTADFDPNAGTVNLTSVTLQNNPAFPSTDVVITRLTPAGNLVWAKRIGGGGHEGLRDLKVDANGNILISGYFELTCDFDPGTANFPLTASGSRDGYIAKYDADGNFIWAKRIGGSSDVQITQIKSDSNGNVYAVGNFFNAIDIDPGTAEVILQPSPPDNFNQYSQDVLVMKLDASGNYQWGGKIGGTASDACYAMDMDADNNLYLSGLAYGNADLDPGTTEFLATPSAGPVFLAKINSNGQFQWAKQFATTFFPDIKQVVAHSDGSILMTGNFVQTITFSPTVSVPGTGVSASDSDIFLAKFDADGNAIWAQKFGGSGQDDVQGMFVGANNTWHLAGDFATSANLNPFGTDTHSVVGFNDIFVIRLAPEELKTDEFSLNDAWSVYPNPSNGNVNLHFDEVLFGSKVSVYTILGQTIAEFEIGQTDKNISLKPGNYLVKTENASASSVKKLIVL